MWNMHDGMGWWMVWGTTFWVLFFAGAAFLVAWVVRSTGGGAAAAPPSRDRAIDILRERYARGELDAESFERMRRELDR